MPDLDPTPVPGVLHQLRADWAAHGWTPAALDSFRMENEGDGGDPAPAGLPDLNAILDGADDPEPAGDPAGDGAPAGDQATPAGTDAPADVDPAAADPAKTGLDALPEEWQKEVREAREEAKRYRLRAKEYEEVYDGLDDDGRGFLLELNKALKAGDSDTAQAMWGQLFADPDAAAAAADPAAAGGDPDAPLTAADIDRLVEEKLATREAKRAEDQAVADITKDAEALGYKPGSRDYVNLLYVANNETGGDLAAADQALKAERQKVIDEFVAAKATDSELHTTPAGDGSAPSGERQITDLRTAKAGLEEWLASQ